ncbi:MAG: GIY-YIG nuclease family protein [Candidatus Gracilibacteria bacterium]|nr:GIY-YIG nuclease family protein [Candidatus Gracilibacteria bacterium]
MYYVYIIRSLEKKDEFYTGFSENLKDRIEEHNSGKSKHTQKYKPWELIFYSAFQDKKQALDFEKYLKTSSGIAFRNKRLIQKLQVSPKDSITYL